MFQNPSKIAKLLLLFGLSLNFVPDAKAKAFFFEPYIGLSKMEVRVDQTFDVADGFYMGAKGGLNFGSKFFAGLDYETGGPYKFHQPLNDTEWNLRMLGAGLGADYKIIRFWLGYYPEMEIQDSESSLKFVGDALKIGFGLLISQRVRANLELIFFNIKEIKSGGQSIDNDIYSAKASQVSISIPLP